MHTRVACMCVYMVKKNNRVLKILYTITAWLYKDPAHVEKKTLLYLMTQVWRLQFEVKQFNT